MTRCLKGWVWCNVDRSSPSLASRHDSNILDRSKLVVRERLDPSCPSCCCTKFGKPYDRSALRVKLIVAIKAASLNHARLHDQRHSNASWLLAKGASLSYVSKHLGHSSVAVTGDIYHHVLPKEHERSMKLLDEIFPIWDTTGIQSLPPADETKRK